MKFAKEEDGDYDEGPKMLLNINAGRESLPMQFQRETHGPFEPAKEGETDVDNRETNFQQDHQ